MIGNSLNFEQFSDDQDRQILGPFFLSPTLRDLKSKRKLKVVTFLGYFVEDMASVIYVQYLIVDYCMPVPMQVIAYAVMYQLRKEVKIIWGICSTRRAEYQKVSL